VCGREFYFIFWHISNVTEANGKFTISTCQQTCRDYHANWIRAFFTNNGFEHHIRLLPRAAGWEKYCGAIERPSPVAVSMEAMWQQGIDTLVKVFSYGAIHVIRRSED
jgi:hypothetical protein